MQTIEWIGFGFDWISFGLRLEFSKILRNVIARPVMGTIFLDIIIIYLIELNWESEASPTLGWVFNRDFM